VAKFEDAIEHVLRHEGGYAETPGGEIVNRGITQHTLRRLRIDIHPRDLSEDQIRAIYREHYWYLRAPHIPTALDELESQAVANKIFDLFVPCAGHQAVIKMLQTAVGTRRDGIFRATTVRFANIRSSLYVVKAISGLAYDYLEEMAENEFALAQNATAREYWRQKRIGWQARANWDGVSL